MNKPVRQIAILAAVGGSIFAGCGAAAFARSVGEGFMWLGGFLVFFAAVSFIDYKEQ